MRAARILLRVSIVVVVLVAGAASAAVAVSQTAWFRDWLRGYVVEEAHKYLNGELSIRRLDGDLFHGVELSGIAIAMNGEPAVSVEQLGLDYNLFQLVTSGISAQEIRLVRPSIHVRHDRDGWSLARLIKTQEQEADRRGPRYPVSVETIAVHDGTIVIDDRAGTPGVDLPDRIEHVDAEFSFDYQPVSYSLEIRKLALRGTDPRIGINQLTGGLAIKDDTLFLDRLALQLQESAVEIDGAIQNYLTTPVIKLQARSDKVALRELAGLVPALGRADLQPSFDLALDGPLDRLGIDGQVRSSAGDVRTRIVTDLLEPSYSVSGDVAVARVNVASLGQGWGSSDITASGKMDLRAGSFTDLNTLIGSLAVSGNGLQAMGYIVDRLDANATFAGRQVTLSAKGAAYGAAVTANGRTKIPEGNEPLAYDFSGQVRAIDLRRMPRRLGAPAVETNINTGYHAAGVLPVGEAAKRATSSYDLALKFAPSTAPGIRVEEGSIASIRARGRDLSYTTDATLTGLNLRELGRAFDVPALADARYESAIGTHVVAEGSGRSLAALRLTATGTARDSSIAGGQVPELAFTADIADRSAHITANGRFSSFDPAVLSGRAEARGRVDGTLDLDATIADLDRGAAVDNLLATARLTLEPSEVGGLVIDRGVLDADLRDSVADIRTLDIAGRELNVQASGALALGETGDSSLRVHADSSRLQEIGTLIDRPLSGIAALDATVTGNRSELKAAGTLQGDGVKYEENGALSLNTTFTARVPDLTFARARVDTDNSATFVTIAGQNINELTAKVAYENRQLNFDALAKQPSRSAGAAGALTLHPDHQEIHLQRLGLEAANQRWDLAPGEAPTIQYGGESIDVSGLRLVNADQEITASGRFGAPGDTLKVGLTNVDLTAIDALLLRPPQFSGRLNATADVRGSKDRPDVTGQFSVAPGGFRDFQYQSFSGTAAYSPEGIELDARLQQNDTQWITAKGHVPPALFRRSPRLATGEIPHGEPAGPADRVDLLIDSSPLGLGLIQGFTTAVENVQGTVEAHVRVIGSAQDPHPTGTITIADGAALVVPTGVTYSNIRGQIVLQPDRVHIEHIVALDNHDSSLSITGNLPVHGSGLTGAELWITGEDFKVVDNELGNVRIQSALELTGQLSAPEIRGDLGITTGRINLDDVLALTGPSVYSTEETRYAGGTTPPQEGEAASTPIFDNLRMNVRVTVPDDLVVRASSLQAPGATVGLGALNVTLGGDLSVLKEKGAGPRLVGSVNTIRGTYDFQGRRFEILRDGTIRFENEERLDPVLDIRTRRVIQGVEARVNVRGRMRSPQIAMSSTPPLEEADILALIVFNQPLNQLGAGDQVNLAARAQEMATGVVAGQLAQAIGTALNLDTFEINVAPESGAGPEVTFGQQLGRNLYVKVQQGVGDDPTTNVIVEYELNRWLRFQSNVVQGEAPTQSLFRRRQGSGADLIILFEK